jgi:hypothetical protein
MSRDLDIFLCATCLPDDDSIEKRIRWGSGESDVKIVCYSLFSSPVLRRRCTFEAWRSIEKAVALGRKINFKRGARGSRNSTTNPRTRPHLPSTLLYSTLQPRSRSHPSVLIHKRIAQLLPYEKSDRPQIWVVGQQTCSSAFRECANTPVNSCRRGLRDS